MVTEQARSTCLQGFQEKRGVVDEVMGTPIIGMSAFGRDGYQWVGRKGRFHMVPPADPVVQGSQELDF